MEKRILGQYGDVLHEEQLWELASGNQMQALGLSQSDDFVTREVRLLTTLTPTGPACTSLKWPPQPSVAHVARTCLAWQEFCLMMLVRLERISPEDLRHCQAALCTLHARCTHAVCTLHARCIHAACTLSGGLQPARRVKKWPARLARCLGVEGAARVRTASKDAAPRLR